jgi:glycosyltransferase involved in cell wall biosynthesis
MRIARVLTRLNLGGPARQVLASDPVLVERGHELVVFAGKPEPGEGDLFDELESRGVDVRRVPGLARGLNPAKDLVALRFLRRELKALAPDILHTHASKAGLVGRRAARPLARRCALVHTFHGHVLEGYFPDFVSRRLIATERGLAAKTARVIAVSHATADDLVRLEVVGEEKLSVVPPGVDLTELLALTHPRPPARQSRGPRELCGIAPDALLVGVVGRLAEVKQPEVALAAFAMIAGRHPTAELVFVGDGDSRRELESRIAALPDKVRPRVHMSGHLDRPAAIFGDLDLLLMSSRTEGLPVALIEAHAAGVPAVAPSVGGISEVLAHERTGLVVGAGEELAFHLDTLLADANRRRVYGQRARMRVATRYSAEALAGRLEAIYEAVLEERSCAS